MHTIIMHAPLANRMRHAVLLFVLSMMLLGSIVWAHPAQATEGAAKLPVALPIQPADSSSIMGWLSDNPAFSRLVDALETTGLDMMLDTEGPFTLFAPTNEAFDALPADLEEQQLADLLRNHIVAGKLTAEQLASAGTVKAVSGHSLTVSGDQVAGASIVEADIQTANGVIFAIDQVITGGR
ncbi:hypothetical protein AWN76_004615 [Rhodothermaceae bacterium RA]|nr:hypothetical protein AWN76_004615 [Rhodothermaceae bacterium RA]